MTHDTRALRRAGWRGGGQAPPLGAEDDAASHALLWDEPDSAPHDGAQIRYNEETGHAQGYGSRPAQDGDGAGGGDWDAIDDLDALGDV
jgi:hypothetical protein